MEATNQELKNLITDLKSKKINLFDSVANNLSKSTRRRKEVNLSRLEAHTKEGDIIIVPGKVLGGGELNHKIKISAFKFSSTALEKLQKSGSTIIPIGSMINENPKGKKIRIIG